MIHARIIAGLLLAASAVLSANEMEVAIADRQLENLGIAFAAPAPAGAATVVEARAQVVVPPDALYVISSAQTGLILRMHAASGQAVSRGQVLAEVQSPDFLTRQQEFLEAVQEAAVAAAQLRRDEQLHAEGIIAARRLEATRAHAVASAARRSEHEQMLRIAGLDREQTAALARSGSLYEVLEIRAPIDGVVLDTHKSAGESVGPSEALARIADISTLWLHIYVPQEDAGRLVDGMRIVVTEPAGSEGVILATGLSVDPGTQTVTARAALDGASTGLKPGQLVRVRVQPEGGSEVSGFAVPVSAVVRNGGRSWVFARTDDGVEAREVSIIGGNDGAVFIGAPGPGGEVAVSGVSALKSLWLAALETDGQ
jgi:cobalt-zinc-cadmium efflux system membrane fusion protein